MSGFVNFLWISTKESGVLSALLLLSFSLLASFFIAHLYIRFFGNRATGSDVQRSFPLLGISITAIFIAIQSSLPLSLGLLGALSIVRFRTPIKEPEEIGFIMLVVACSLTCATYKLVFLAAILLLAVVALLVMQRYGLVRSTASRGSLTVSLGPKEYRAVSEELMALLSEKLPGGSLENLSETEQQVHLGFTFANLTPELVLELQDQIKSLSPEAHLNIFFARTGLI